RWSDDAAFQAELAQRLDTQLIRSAACPAGGAIPAMDVRRVRHRGQGLRVFYIFQAARAQRAETKSGWSTGHRDQRPSDERPGRCGVPEFSSHPVCLRPCAFVAVGALAAEKRLFLNASRKRLLGALSGKKPCNINERLNPF